jgi:uncharacterized protein YybS (DUF2232 family)
VKAAALNLEGVSLASLSFILTLLPVFGPVEGLFLTTLAPFPLVVLAIKYPWRYALGVVGLEAAGLVLLGGIQTLLFIGQYGLVPIVMAWAMRRRCSIAQAVVWSVGVPLGVGGVLFLFYSLSVHQAPHLLLANYLDQLLTVMREHLAEQTQRVDEEQLAAFVEAFPQLVLTIFPALLVMNHLVMNVLNYVLVRYYCRRSRPPIHLDPEDLACWRASDYIVWVFLASGAALLLPIAPISTIGLNVFLVTLTVYLFQGLAIAVFWGRRMPFPPGVRLLLVLTVLLVAGSLFIVLCIIAGLFDLWVDFRRQRGRPLTS